MATEALEGMEKPRKVVLAEEEGFGREVGERHGEERLGEGATVLVLPRALVQHVHHVAGRSLTAE